MKLDWDGRFGYRSGRLSSYDGSLLAAVAAGRPDPYPNIAMEEAPDSGSEFDSAGPGSWYGSPDGPSYGCGYGYVRLAR